MEPSSAIEDPLEREQARIIATALVLVAVITAAGVAVYAVTVPQFKLTAGGHAVALLCIAGLYRLACTRHYRWAARLACAIVLCAAIVGGMREPEDPVWWAFMLVAVLLGTLLDLRTAAAVAVLAALTVVGVEIARGAETSRLIGRLALHATFSPILLAVAYYRARYEAERRRGLQIDRRVLEAAERLAGIGHWVQRADSEEVEISEALRALLGSRERRLPKARLLDLFEPREKVAALLSHPQAAATVSDISVQMPSGKPLRVSVAVERVQSQGKAIVIGTVKDLTETIATEEGKAELQQRLSESQRLETMGRIAGGVAHDFNNLLTVITGSAALARDSDAAEREELLDELDTAAERGSHLVKQLLAYARKQVLEPVRLELWTTVQGLETLLNSLPGPGQLELIAETEEALWVNADPAQLEQVVVSLVANSQLAISESGIIEVRVGTVSSGPDDTPLQNVPCAYLVVADDGAGIPPETMPRIFEPFFSTRGPSGGSGLGLATVHGVVAQSGGVVEVQSTVGEGTTFHVYLPLLDGNPNPTPEIALEAPESKPVVLVVDDEELVLRMTVRQLARAGYEVLAARGPDEAREVFAEHVDRIGLVISDVLMPGTDGIELTDDFKRRSPGLEVVLMSGYSVETIAKHGVDPLQVTLLRKPFSRRDLLRALQVRGR